MHEPWRHRPRRDTDTRVIPRMSARHSGYLFRNREALTPPQLAARIVNDANGRHLLRNVQADKIGHLNPRWCESRGKVPRIALLSAGHAPTAITRCPHHH